MSFGHYATYAVAAALALGSISACGDDEPDPTGAGSGAGTTSAGGQGGEAATHAGAGGVSGTSAGAGGTSAGAGGTNAGTGGTNAGAGGMSSGGMAGTSAGAGGNSQDAGTDSGRDAGPALEGCVVAQRIDECCPSWAAVTRAEAFAEPCLVAIGEPPLRSSEAQACSPQVCPAIVCPDLPPDSRVAEPIGPSGACTFVDECHAEATCVIGVDMTQCCPCPDSMPETLVEREPCVIYEAMSALPDGCQNPCPVDCAECPDVAEPSCLVRSSTSLCQ